MRTTYSIRAFKKFELFIFIARKDNVNYYIDKLV